MNSDLFLKPRFDIYYIALHCIGIALDLVSDRARSNDISAYESVENILKNLKDNFGRKNEKKSALTQLNEPFMWQRHNEPFIAFAARLSAVMSMTTHSDVMKMRELRKRLNPRLKDLVVVVRGSNNYRQYVNRIADIANNVTDRDHERNYQGERQVKPKSRWQQHFSNKPREDSAPASRDRQTRKPTRKGVGAEDGGIARLDKETKKLVMDKGACAKCFRPGHNATDPKRPCKDDPPTDVGEAKVRLAALHIPWQPQSEDADPYSSEYYSSSDSEN